MSDQYMTSQHYFVCDCKWEYSLHCTSLGLCPLTAPAHRKLFTSLSHIPAPENLLCDSPVENRCLPPMMPQTWFKVVSAALCLDVQMKCDEKSCWLAPLFLFPCINPFPAFSTQMFSFVTSVPFYWKTQSHFIPSVSPHWPCTVLTVSGCCV